LVSKRRAVGIGLIDRTLTERGGTESPVAFGIEQLTAALNEAGVRTENINFFTQTDSELILAVGLVSDPLIHRLLVFSNVGASGRIDAFKPRATKQPSASTMGSVEVEIPLEGELPAAILDPEVREGIAIRWCRYEGARVLAVAGTDAVGLMYGLLEIADRVRLEGAGAFDGIEDAVDLPDHRIRGLDRFIMGPMDDEWFYSDDFWEYYLDRLAYCRFNRFVIVSGFDTAYLSPPYPYFVRVPGYENVRAAGLTDKQLQRNLDRLRRIGRACRRRGIEFVFGTWQQTPWTRNQTVQIEGLPEDEAELADYCTAGLKALLEQCEEIDVIHFRVNHEAGIGDQKSNEAFWKQLIDAVAIWGSRVKLDLRAKGLTDGMIQHALDQGLDVAVPTKYWCEQAALPHHLTQMRREELTQLDNLNHSRRYSYADLLRKPRWYDVIYRLWSLGSTTLFMWADPDYIRRFSASCNLGEAAGFEVAAPLSMKGGHAAIQQKPWPIFDDPELRSGKWEDERYWLYYLQWGRIGYSAGSDPEVWRRELRARFGEKLVDPVERAIRSASRIIPLITAFHMPMHPMLTYWPEFSTGAALFAENNHNSRFNGTFYGDVSYGSAEPSDPGLFYGVDEYAKERAGKRVKDKYTPLQVAGWLQGFQEEVSRAVGQVDRLVGKKPSAELKALRLDLLMLADLAAFHSAKILAAVALGLSSSSKGADRGLYLRTSLERISAARTAWISLSDRGIGAYHDPLEFNAGSSTARRGQWRDYIPEIDADIAQLEDLLKGASSDAPSRRGDVRRAADSQTVAVELAEEESWPRLEVELPPEWPAGSDLVVEVQTGAADRFAQGLTLRYRHANQLEGAFKSTKMTPAENGYRGVIPGRYIRKEWDLLVYITAVLSDERILIHPGLYHPSHALPYFVVKT
jgi:hypothetical protein